MNRYKNNAILQSITDFNLVSKPKYATSELCSQIYYACENGEIPFFELQFKQGDRLDHLASKYYGSGLDWWVIAAASGISWWLQINENTRIKVPNLVVLKQRFNL
jgi:hypothetical protein